MTELIAEIAKATKQRLSMEQHEEVHRVLTTLIEEIGPIDNGKTLYRYRWGHTDKSIAEFLKFPTESNVAFVRTTHFGVLKRPKDMNRVSGAVKHVDFDPAAVDPDLAVQVEHMDHDITNLSNKVDAISDMVIAIAAHIGVKL